MLIGITRGSFDKQLNRMSDTREQMLQAAALVLSAVLTAGGYALFLWMRTPIVDARRLADEGEPEQEATFADPLDANPKTRLYVGIVLPLWVLTLLDADLSLSMSFARSSGCWS